MKYTHLKSWTIRRWLTDIGGHERLAFAKRSCPRRSCAKRSSAKRRRIRPARESSKRLFSIYGFLVVCWIVVPIDPLVAQDEPPQDENPPVAVMQHDNPAVEAILQSDPVTPEALLRSVILLVELGEPELAKPFLKNLVEAELDEDQMADLSRQIGSARLLRLAFFEPLAPDGRMLAKALMDAAGRQAQDPRRLADLVGKLADPATHVRRRALVGLMEAKAVGVTYLLGVLADKQRADLHGPTRAALTAMESTAVGPLLGALETSDPALRAEVIQVCGGLAGNFRRWAPFLVGPALTAENSQVREVARRALIELQAYVPTKEVALGMLEAEARAFWKGRTGMTMDHQGQVELWRWDDGEKTCVMSRLTAEDAGVLLTGRLAAALVTLQPRNESYRQLFLAGRLGSAKILTGMAGPLPSGVGSARQLARKMGTGTVEGVLEMSLDDGHMGAAIGAAEMLGESGTGELLIGPAGRRAALVRAVNHANRRLSFTALETIIRIKPTEAFPGSSLIAESLGFYAATLGERRAIIADARMDTGAILAGMLAQLGYEAEVVTDGRRFIERATRNGDVELLLIQTAIDRFPTRELLYRVRRDPRIGRLPIGLISRPDGYGRAQGLAKGDSLTLAFARPDELTAMQGLVNRLIGLASRDFVPPAERRGNAIKALGWLTELSVQPDSFYDIRRQISQVDAALYVPELAHEAVVALAQAAHPSSQRALVDFASLPSIPHEGRSNAASAFRRSVSHYGILLTSREILRQYDRYNASESADLETQKVLALILDTLESGTARRQP